MYHTPQENFWAGEFGDEYTQRNTSKRLVPPAISFFSRIFSRIPTPHSMIEFGANIGCNLQAMHVLFPNLKIAAVEINPIAAKCMRQLNFDIEVFETSILDFQSDSTWDITLIKGVLIHMNPDHLPAVYDKLFNSSKKFICLAEYYNPTPVELDYRGHGGKLFKRDFAGEMLDRFPQLELVDYGFYYHRDPNFPQDDLNWFLLRKKEEPASKDLPAENAE